MCYTQATARVNIGFKCPSMTEAFPISQLRSNLGFHKDIMSKKRQIIDKKRNTLKMYMD